MSPRSLCRIMPLNTPAASTCRWRAWWSQSTSPEPGRKWAREGRSCRRQTEDKPRQTGEQGPTACQGTREERRHRRDSEPEIRWNIIALLREMSDIEEQAEQWVTLWRNQQLGKWMESWNMDYILWEPLKEGQLHDNVPPSTRNEFCQRKWMFAKIFVRDAQFCGHQNIFLPLSFHCEAAQTKNTQVFIERDDSSS